MRNDQWRTFGEARRIVRRDAPLLLRRYGMVAVGVGFKTKDGERTDEISVKAFVSRKLPSEQLPPEQLVPKTLEAPGARVLTDVDEMAPPTAPGMGNLAFALASSRMRNRLRQRPISGGDSISGYPGTLGTMAALVRDRFSAAPSLILSCNHVLAALNQAPYGQPVVQPSAGDGGTIAFDQCGWLLRRVPLVFGFGTNRVDAAVALATTSAVPVIDFVGLPAGVRSGNALSPGTRVFKVGRTTRLTTATVSAVHVSGWISYSFQPLLSAFFTEQIVTTGTAGFGDSGSLLFDDDRNAVGLLFGGTLNYTFYNDILNVENELGISVVTSAREGM